MYQVGTGAGDVHKQKQGTGLGTVLTPGKEIEYAYLLNKDREKSSESVKPPKMLRWLKSMPVTTIGISTRLN